LQFQDHLKKGNIIAMPRRYLYLIFASVVFFAFAVFSKAVLAQDNSQKLEELQKQIAQYENEITKLKGQATTLTNQIAQFDVQIKLTTLKITETEEKIDMLTGRIGQLEVSLGALTRAFSSRASETYKMARLDQPFLFIASAPDINTAVSRFFYLRKIQEADRDLMIRLQSAQTTYQGQKDEQEVLQGELQKQKVVLDSQKKAKANLLAQTKNDEKKFQQLLAQARSEYEAIQAILAGKGTEEEVGEVGAGQKIASIIQGTSCNSSGSHLHFMVAQAGNTLNPFSYLKSGISFENDSGGDVFNPSGGWDWPISAPIDFNQGYGSDTWCIKYGTCGRIYSFHNGIDINSPNSEVKAVVAGTLFRGSYSGSGGCRLRYVRIDHADSDLETYYLHVNY